ncbi:MAG TPA: shikimate dehydrogenase [Burkholderiales bacterium]|nr:shikimate dehydrogenase [Burkholderiales bacterium]
MKLSPGTSYRLGLIGAGIQASRTPSMHESEAAAQGLRCEYRLIDLDVLGVGAEALRGLVEDAERAGYAGLNITHPCKQAVLPLLHGLSDDARAIGAVNTVVFRDGRRTGHNTDWWGFAESFRRNMGGTPADSVVQLGAGGAGAAVAHALLTSATRSLAIFDIDAARAARLAGDLGTRFGDARVIAGTDLRRSLGEADGLVHATPTGMASHPGLPLDAALLRPSLWVAEIVYFPLETGLLRAARALGCRTMNGAGMAVFQAAAAFRLFTGIAPDAARMQRHFESLGAS